ncbi:MAG TPA: ABC transporter permease [Anaerolineae bacterium]|nr:ABC transporter permease [Anaerolineae bacterium]
MHAPAIPEGPAPRKRIGRVREFLYFARRDRKIFVSLIIIGSLAVVALVGPFLRDYGPNEYVGPAMQAPSSEYWFGTTTFGQDVFVQFVHGLGATFFVGIVGGGLAAFIGMTVGFVAGYRGGLIDELLNMLTNVVLVIPTLMVLIVIVAYVNARGLLVEAVFIGFTAWPWAARAIRAQTMSLRSRDFVDLARLTGVSTRKIISGEIAPNMSSYLMLTFILLFGNAVLIAATLDFIGLGPTEGISLGLMMNNAVLWSALQLGMWWWFIPPGVGIVLIVGSLYVMNVGLDQIFNPRLRKL